MTLRGTIIAITVLQGIIIPALLIPELRTYWKVAGAALALTMVASIIAILASGQYKQGKK